MTQLATPIPFFDSLENTKDIPPHLLAIVNSISIPYALAEYQKACHYLVCYQGSLATFNAYRRELEKFLQWLWHIRKISLAEVKRSDIEDYLHFCQQPPKSWIGFLQVPRFIEHGGERVANPDWRPFVVATSKKRIGDRTPSRDDYLLSQSGIQAIFASLSSFYNYLIQEEYLEINPILQIRQKSKFIRKQQTKRPIRRLSELQWTYVIKTAEAMANSEPEKHERTLFIMSALYGMYLRISELAASIRWIPLMGHFYRDQNQNWWFKTVGKGNKERDITVSDAMLEALKRYRKFLGLSSLPSPGETTPLISKNKGKGAMSDTRHIRRIVQYCFDATIEKLQQDKLTEESEQLKSATVHWLRHTGISDDVKHRPREHVRDDAGHSSSVTTDRYIDVELVARHKSGRGKLIKQS